MIREILEIDEAKCDGCGQCIPSCAEGALHLHEGKVRLRADALCDGLGACLGECPQGALRVVQREAAAFDERAVAAHLASTHPAAAMPQAPACPGSRPRTLRPAPRSVGSLPPPGERAGGGGPRLSVLSDAPPPLVPTGGSRLGQWPVQIALVSPAAAYLDGADLLVAADCVPFAYARFHDDFLDGRRVLVGCPKLDDLAGHVEKLTEIFRRAAPRSVTVVKMQVPCCQGIAAAARQAMARAGGAAPVEVVTVGVDGAIVGRG